MTGYAVNQQLEVRTTADGGTIVRLNKNDSLTVTCLGRVDDGRYRVELSACREGVPRSAAHVMVRTTSERAAIRKATGAALLFYDEDEAWPSAALTSDHPA